MDFLLFHRANNSIFWTRVDFNHIPVYWRSIYRTFLTCYGHFFFVACSVLHFEKEILIQINETQNPMSTEPPNSQNPSHGTHNDLRYTLPKRPVFKREYASKLSWSDWQKNYISDLVMSRKSTWEVHFHNERERKRFSNEIIEMQSQQNTMKNKTKREVDRVKEEYARMLALSCVHRKYRFSKLDPFQEERDKLTKKNLEMFEESYKAHLRSRPREESPKSAPGFGRERSFDNPPSNSQCVHHRSSDHLQTEAIPPRSSLPGDKVSGIKELSKLYPAFSKKKPAMNRNMDLSVKGASLQSKKNINKIEIKHSANSFCYATEGDTNWTWFCCLATTSKKTISWSEERL